MNKLRIINWIVKRFGYDHFMVWKKKDRFKLTKRMANGGEAFIMNTKENLSWFVVYKNNQYETILEV